MLMAVYTVTQDTMLNREGLSATDVVLYPLYPLRRFQAHVQFLDMSVPPSVHLSASHIGQDQLLGMSMSEHPEPRDAERKA